MPDHEQPEHADADAPADAADVPTELEPVVEDGEELGEISGGGDITDLGGDSPSS